MNIETATWAAGMHQAEEGLPAETSRGVAFAVFNWACPPQPDGHRLQRAQSGKGRQVTSSPNSRGVINKPAYVADGSSLGRGNLDYAPSSSSSACGEMQQFVSAHEGSSPCGQTNTCPMKPLQCDIRALQPQYPAALWFPAHHFRCSEQGWARITRGGASEPRFTAWCDSGP